MKTLLPCELSPQSPSLPFIRQFYVKQELCGLRRMETLIKVFSRLSFSFPDWILVILGEGPDREALEAQIRSAGLIDRALLPGRAGNMVDWYDPQKNHLGFVHAAAVIHQRMPDVHFLLAGTGVDEGNADLLNAITRQGLSGHIHLLGRREDMPRLMAALDVLASPSCGEAFPLVLGEAMACCVPCVVTDVGDSAEIVGETGRVVEVDDMQGLAYHIVELLRLPRVEKADLGRQAREHIAAHFEIGEVTRTYQAFYERTAKGNI